MKAPSWRRAVLKVGSALIAPDETGVSTKYLLPIARFINECHERGQEVVLVSSGSVAAGRKHIAIGVDRPDLVGASGAECGKWRFLRYVPQLYRSVRRSRDQRARRRPAQLIDAVAVRRRDLHDRLQCRAVH